jgi:protein CpxP
MMTLRVQGWRGVGMVVLSVGLAAVAPATNALQPEPELMIEADVGASAGPLAAMMGDGPAGPHVAPGRMHGGPPLLPPFIHLTEQQQDKLFELRHAQEPALRAQFKELHSAHEQLREIALGENYDEARARQVVARAAQANSEIELMHARMQHAAFALLTPEQRKRIDECKPGAEGTPPRGCFPPR